MDGNQEEAELFRAEGRAADAVLPKVPDLPPPREAWWRYRDTKATLESAAVEGNRDLAQEEATNDHDRMEGLRKHVFICVRVGLWVACVLTVIGLIIWAAHVVLPKSWCWLEDEQLSTIQHVLTTIVFSGLAGSFAQRVMKVPVKPKSSGD